MASAARPNKGGKDENVLKTNRFGFGLDSFLEGRSNEQPSRVFLFYVLGPKIVLVKGSNIFQVMN